MKKIGILGGTFNPLHFGHIHIALNCKELKGLDHVIFSPNHQPFFSKQDHCIEAKHRFAMTALGIEGIEGLALTDYEVKKPGPSYTIDLVRYVKSFLCRPEDQIFLLLGADLMVDFSQWKDPCDLLDLVTPLIIPRNSLRKDCFLPPQFQNLSESNIVEIPRMEISSTQIRSRLKKGLYCGHLVPEKVLDYIRENKLYL